MRAVLAPLMALLMLSGCLEAITGNDDENDPSLLPEWKSALGVLYTFVTPEFGEDSARLVVADSINDEGHWMVGTLSEKEAQRHAVVNHNPFLGRVTFDQLRFMKMVNHSVFSISLGSKVPSGILSFSLNHGMLEPLQSMIR